MKRYRTIVIDGKKLFRILKILLWGIIGFVLISVISTNLSPMETQNTVMEDTKFVQKISSAFFNAKIFNSSKIIAQEIPYINSVNKSGINPNNEEIPPTPPTETKSPQPIEPEPSEIYIKPENRREIREVDLSPLKLGKEGVVIGNDTSFEVDVQEFLSEAPNIDMKNNGPKVLIIHTHGTEAYAYEGLNYYDKTEGDRSDDNSKNVIKAGEIITDIFNKKGIETIHDTTQHDVPSFNGSYASSLKAINKYKEEYPGIQVILDIHRDSIVYKDEVKAKPVTEINGQKSAQLMFVVGTNQKGLEHPNWRENLRTAIHFQKAINERYPTLMRHINLRKERFNGHTSNASLIIETGSSGNTLSEALYGLSLAAECIADYLNELRS